MLQVHNELTTNYLQLQLMFCQTQLNDESSLTSPTLSLTVFNRGHFFLKTNEFHLEQEIEFSVLYLCSQVNVLIVNPPNFIT